MMNRIIKEGQNYTLITSNGEKYPCTRWYEKKTNAWHVKLPKDNPTGRTYIRESKFDNTNEYEFDDKLEHRSGLSTGGWRSKMTEEEAQQVAEAEALIEAIKADCMTRQTPKLEKGSVEWYEAEIAKYQAKLAKVRGN